MTLVAEYSFFCCCYFLYKSDFKRRNSPNDITLSQYESKKNIVDQSTDVLM